MALSNIVVPSREVYLENADCFTVRGLCFEDTAILLQEHGGELNGMFQSYISDGGVDLDRIDMADLAPKMVKTAPKIVAKVIALAADEPNQDKVVRNLPFPVQVEALQHVGELTFTSPGSAKKTLETIINMMQATGSVVSDLTTSTSGSAD